LSLITDGFPNHAEVQQRVQEMILEESLGMQADRFLREFAVTGYSGILGLASSGLPPQGQ